LIISAGRSPPAPHPQSPGVEPRPLLRPGLTFIDRVYRSLAFPLIFDPCASERGGRQAVYGSLASRERGVCLCVSKAGPGARTRPSG
jgi:hypothetical protein